MTESEIISLFWQIISLLDGHFVVKPFDPDKLPFDFAAIPAIEAGGK